MEEMSMRGYEWIRQSGGVYYMGISTEAARELGPVMKVDFPTLSLVFKTGERIASLEADTQGIALYAPFDCMVTEKNELLCKDPSTLSNNANTHIVGIRRI